MGGKGEKSEKQVLKSIMAGEGEKGAKQDENARGCSSSSRRKASRGPDGPSLKKRAKDVKSCTLPLPCAFPVPSAVHTADAECVRLSSPAREIILAHTADVEVCFEQARMISRQRWRSAGARVQTSVRS